MTLVVYVAAALAEIAGCFAFWAWARSGASVMWLLPGVAALVLFAWLLSRVEVEWAGRAFAAYGGIYITVSLLWLWLAEARKPDVWDLAGATVCLLGAGLIVLGPRAG